MARKLQTLIRRQGGLYFVLYAPVLKILEAKGAPQSWRRDAVVDLLIQVALHGIPVGTGESNAKLPHTSLPSNWAVAEEMRSYNFACSGALTKLSREDPFLFFTVMAAIAKKVRERMGSPKMRAALELSGHTHLLGLSGKEMAQALSELLNKEVSTKTADHAKTLLKKAGIVAPS